MSYNRYSADRNPTFYESLAEHTIDDVRAGGLPHGGNFEVLLYYAPELAVDTLEGILSECGVPEEEWPRTIEGIADLFEWELTGQKTEFIRRNSRPETGKTSPITELAMAAKVLGAKKRLNPSPDNP